ncbi:MAG TPA: hypothetical protein VMS54_01220 [Vicinamibacterales bacterium]|nr:hypothetical protein [Vicinamibacterales bacterium]
MTPTADEFTAAENALRGLVHALLTGRADEVLAAEGPLQAATAELTALRASGRGLDPARVQQAARAIRIAVLECQALGYSAEALRRILIPDAAYPGAGPRVRGSEGAPIMFRSLDSRA